MGRVGAWPRNDFPFHPALIHAGLEFLDGLQALGGKLVFPTVMLTGTGSEMVAVDAMKAGAQDYQMKNRLQPEALHRALHAAVYKATADRLLARQHVELGRRKLFG